MRWKCWRSSERVGDSQVFRTLLVPHERYPGVSSPTRLRRDWQNDARQNYSVSLPPRRLSKRPPRWRGAQRPPCDFFPASIPGPMTRARSLRCSQNPAQVPGDSGGKVALIVPPILPEWTSENLFLPSICRVEGSVSVAERVQRALHAQVCSHAARAASCRVPSCRDWVYVRNGFVLLQQGHEKSNIERDDSEGEYCYHRNPNHPTFSSPAPTELPPSCFTLFDSMSHKVRIRRS